MTNNYTWAVHVVCWNNQYYNRCPPNFTEPVVQNETVEIAKAQVQYNELYANITSLTQTGLLTIQFKDYMQTRPFGYFNRTQLHRYFNMSTPTFDVYVVHDEYDGEDTMSGVYKKNPMIFNLTWECVSYYGYIMQLQIDFMHPKWISNRGAKDRLVVNLRDRTYFRSNFTRSPWYYENERWKNFTKKFKPQILRFLEEDSSDNNRSIRDGQRRLEYYRDYEHYGDYDWDIHVNMSYASPKFDDEGYMHGLHLSLDSLVLETEIVKQDPYKYGTRWKFYYIFFYIQMIMTLFWLLLLGFWFTRCHILLFTFICALQVVAHMPLMDVYLPENVLYVYSAIVPIACCDWLGFDWWRTKWFAKWLFSFDFITHQYYGDRVFNEHSRYLGFDTHNFILTMGSFFTLWLAYMFRVGYLAGFKSYIFYAR